MDAVEDLGGTTSRTATSRLEIVLNNEPKSRLKVPKIDDLIKLNTSQSQLAAGSFGSRIRDPQKISVGSGAGELNPCRAKQRDSKLQLNQSQLRKIILNFLKNFIQLDSILEKKRQILLLRPDFLPSQLFLYLDDLSKTRLSTKIASRKLHDIGIEVDVNQLQEIFDHFTAAYLGLGDEISGISYPDFLKIFFSSDSHLNLITSQRCGTSTNAEFIQVKFFSSISNYRIFHLFHFSL